MVTNSKAATLDIVVNLVLNKVNSQAKTIANSIEQAISKTTNKSNRSNSIGKSNPVITNLIADAKNSLKIKKELTRLSIEEDKKRKKTLKETNIQPKENQAFKYLITNSEELTKSRQKAISVSKLIQQEYKKEQKIKAEENKNFLKSTQTSVRKNGDPITEASRLTKEFKKMASEIQSVSSTGLDVKSQWTELDVLIKRANQTLGKEMVPNLNKIRYATKQMNFDFLSMIFGGMALRDTFGGALRTIATGFNEITLRQTAFGRATTKVQANFSYLKFAIGSAFNNPVILAGMNMLSSGLETIAVWVSDHPNFTAILIGIAGALATLGAIVFVVGQFTSITMGIEALVGYSDKLAIVAKSLGSIAKKAGLIGAITLTADFVISELGLKTNFISALAKAIGVGGILSLVKGVKGKTVLKFTAGLTLALSLLNDTNITNGNSIGDFITTALTGAFLGAALSSFLKFNPTTRAVTITLSTLIALELKFKFFEKSNQLGKDLRAYVAKNNPTMDKTISNNSKLILTPVKQAQSNYKFLKSINYSDISNNVKGFFTSLKNTSNLDTATTKVKLVDTSITSVGTTSDTTKDKVNTLVDKSNTKFTVMQKESNKSIKLINDEVTSLGTVLDETIKDRSFTVTKYVNTVYTSSGGGGNLFSTVGKN